LIGSTKTFMFALGVLDALNAPVTTPSTAPSDDKEPAISATGIAVLKSIISNEANKYPPELRANVSTLVGTIFRNLGHDTSAKDQLVLSFAMILKHAVDEKDAPEKLKQAAKWATDLV
jgi:hypothetical protein